MIAKVILINPLLAKDQPNDLNQCFPQGLLYLATVLRHNGIDVKVVDVDNCYENNAEAKGFDEAEYIEDNLCKYIKKYMPDVIGIGCLFSGAFKSLINIAKGAKKQFPDIPIVIGGIHPTLFPGEILRRYTCVDYIIMGEGEVTFLELIKYITGNVKRLSASMDGIAYRNKGGIKQIPKRTFIDNIDTIPFVDYSVINVKDYKMNTSGWYSPKNIMVGQPFPIISSRSCPQRCTYCSMWLLHGKKIRFRSPENVLDQMERLYVDYNVRYFQFMDDNMTFDKKRTIEICNGILKRKMNIQFDTPNGVAINRLDQEIIDAMVDAGLIRISLGIESGSEYIRNKSMKKGLNTEKIFEVVKACKKHSTLFINSFFIIGMPQETHKTLEETYALIKELSLDKFAMNFATPYPGTELFDYCIEHKLLSYEAEDYVDVAYLQPRADRPHFKPHELEIEDLVRFRQRCYDYQEKIRMDSDLPNNYPLRYVGYAND